MIFENQPYEDKLLEIMQKKSLIYPEERKSLLKYLRGY